MQGTNPDNLVVNMNEDHSVLATSNLVLIVLPDEHQYNTEFSFEYYTDGVLYEWYWVIYNEYFGGPNGKKRLIFIFVCVVLIVVLIFLVFGAGIKSGIQAICCPKKTSRNKVEIK